MSAKVQKKSKMPKDEIPILMQYVKDEINQLLIEINKLEKDFVDLGNLLGSPEYKDSCFYEEYEKKYSEARNVYLERQVELIDELKKKIVQRHALQIIS